MTVMMMMMMMMTMVTNNGDELWWRIMVTMMIDAMQPINHQPISPSTINWFNDASRSVEFNAP